MAIKKELFKQCWTHTLTMYHGLMITTGWCRSIRMFWFVLMGGWYKLCSIRRLTWLYMNVSLNKSTEKTTLLSTPIFLRLFYFVICHPIQIQLPPQLCPIILLPLVVILYLYPDFGYGFVLCPFVVRLLDACHTLPWYLIPWYLIPDTWYLILIPDTWMKVETFVVKSVLQQTTHVRLERWYMIYMTYHQIIATHHHSCQEKFKIYTDFLCLVCTHKQEERIDNKVMRCECSHPNRRLRCLSSPTSDYVGIIQTVL